MTKFSFVAVATALALSAAAAQAATMNVVGVSGVWSDYSGGQRVNTATAGQTAELRWGEKTGITGQSGYDFTGISPSGPHQSETAFDIGYFTHHNYPIKPGTSITQAVLDVTFSFYLNTDPGKIYERTSQFVFDHFETPNAVNNCANGEARSHPSNGGQCADRVTPVTNPSSSETFDVKENGQINRYIFDVTGFDIGENFWTREGQLNTAKLQAQFTYDSTVVPAPVPLPAAGWMLVAGVGGLAAVSRRRKRRG